MSVKKLTAFEYTNEKQIPDLDSDTILRDDGKRPSPEGRLVDQLKPQVSHSVERFDNNYVSPIKLLHHEETEHHTEFKVSGLGSAGLRFNENASRTVTKSI